MSDAPAGQGSCVHESWHLDDVPAGDRDEVWRSLICDTHLPWALAPQPPDGPGGGECIERWSLGDIDLVTCRAGSCSGCRRRSQQRATDGDFVAILFVRAGHEIIGSPAGDFTLGPGDILAWDSASQLDFTVPGRLHKQTLLIPRPRFQEVASRPELVTYRNLQSLPGAPLLRRYLDLIADGGLVAGTEMTGAASAAGDAALNLLGAVAAGGQAESTPAGHAALLGQAKDYIEAHLGERDLAADRVARAIAVSPRLLYRLFENEGDAVHAYVRRRRLAHVHARLTRPGPRPTVGQLAARWGFADADALGRSFRAQYGLPPGQVGQPRPVTDHAAQAGEQAAGAVPAASPHS